MIASDYQNTNKPMALILTIVFHGLLLVLFIFLAITTPNPPYPTVGGGSGLEVNFGNTDFGSGNNNSENLIPLTTQEIKTNTNDDNYITQDNENTNAVAVKKDDKNKKNDKPVINEPVLNQNALYKKKNSGDGTTNQSGNQGKQNGDVNALNYKGNGGSGGGDGKGHGDGIGDDDGSGTGPGGKNKGISFNIKDRTAKSIPKPNYNTKDEGIVVVKIWVDKKGNVTKAEAGVRGSTTTNTALWKSALEAAKRAKFNTKDNAPEEQTGTISYNFINLN